MEMVPSDANRLLENCIGWQRGLATAVPPRFTSYNLSCIYLTIFTATIDIFIE